MMNSALKPIIPQPQPGGQGSPAKGNVATVSNAVAHPQGAQNSLNHGSNNLVGQNLTHHQGNPPQLLPHAAPSMAPVPANLVQMAQNMSHHGNLSHIQNSAPPPPVNTAASPAKSASTSSPLSLVADKVTPSQPLALTRTPEKKESEASGHSNGNIESPKAASNTSNAIKAQNPEVKEKQDIAKTSPSTPKPPEKPASVPGTPQKPEASNSVGTADGPTQPKVATANEVPEKSPAKPAEPKPAPTADVAPKQSDSKPLPESAKDSPVLEKAPTPQKAEAAPAESPKIEAAKPEEKKIEAKVDKAEDKPVEPKKEDSKPEKVECPKKEVPDKLEKVEEKAEPKTPKAEPKAAPKSTLKLATVTPPVRKRRQASPSKTNEVTSAKKSAECDSTSDSRSKRNRTKVQLYQSPTPDIAMATKLSASAGRSTPTKQNDDKLIVFYKNEYLAVRNSEGSFYVCQTMQNVYRTTRKIKIRWLSQDKTEDPSGETYKPDFYDVTDMECVLTTLSLTRAPAGGKAMLLKPAEKARASSILERAIKAEKGEKASLDVTEEHPDGLDLSLYTDESQLENKSRKRQAAKKPEASETPSPAKKARTTPKRSPKSAKKAKASPKSNKSAGSTPILASAKTATAVTEKPKVKHTPKRATAPPKVKVETPVNTPTRGRRAAKDNKPSPIVPTPSTSTGKATRTPRKPPSKK